MNISLYTRTCTRKPWGTWNNWKNRKNPPQGLGGLRAVFRVIPVIPVIPCTPRRACVVPTTEAGLPPVGTPGTPDMKGNSAPPEFRVESVGGRFICSDRPQWFKGRAL